MSDDRSVLENCVKNKAKSNKNECKMSIYRAGVEPARMSEKSKSEYRIPGTDQLVSETIASHEEKTAATARR